MQTCLVIAHRDDLIARAIADLFLAKRWRVVTLAHWSDLELSFGCQDGAEYSSLVALPSRLQIPLHEISLVIFRETPRVHSRLPRRTRDYAEDEWQASLSVLTSLKHCPVLNPPFPDSPSGYGHHSFNGGHRLSLERRLGPGTSLLGCLSNLAVPPGDDSAFCVVGNGPVTPEAIAWARLGFELLSTRPLRDQNAALYWIVDQSVVVDKSLDLRSGVVEHASHGIDCIRLAEMLARECKLAFGTLWLLPGSDGLWHFGGLNLFPPQSHACGDEMALAAAIWDHYGRHA